MDTHLLERATALVADAPGRAMSLSALCIALSIDGVEPVPEPSALAAALLRDRRFELVAGSDPLALLPLACDPSTRDLYRAALRTAAPLAARVVLRPQGDAAPPDDAIALIDASLRQLRGSEVPGIADRIAEAHAEYGAIVRSVPVQPG